MLSDERRVSVKTRWSIAFLLFCIFAAIILFRQFQDRSQAEAFYSDEQIRMEIQAAQSVAMPMKETAFQIFITELSENPVMSADLELNISMPDMFCGVFPAVIVESEPGVYTATAVPVMQGLWQAEAALRWKDQSVKVRTLFKVR